MALKYRVLGTQADKKTTHIFRSIFKNAFIPFDEPTCGELVIQTMDIEQI